MKLLRLVLVLNLFWILPGFQGIAQPRSLFMSEQDEIELGKKNHPQVLAEFGGAYNNADLAEYIQSLGDYLASTSERSNLKFTFTVLNSPIVNAFAVPGGYIYVTRGLLALADNEAEVAGVLAHEIGHIAARHGAQRYDKTMLANIGMILLGIGTGSGEIAQAGGALASVLLQSYSREQEFEADELGVRYIARANFDPQAMVSFLKKLQQETSLEAKILGQEDETDAMNIMATHPRTVDRVAEAIREATKNQVKDPIVAQDIYLKKIDGIIYGDSPDEGIIRKRKFGHPQLNFSFEVPEDFRLFNFSDKVIAKGPQNSGIVFDQVKAGQYNSMTTYLKTWAKNNRLNSIESLTIKNHDAATGLIRIRNKSGQFDQRLLAIDYGDKIYRFLFVTPVKLTSRYDQAFKDTAYSFGPISQNDKDLFRPQIIKVIDVSASDTPQSLANKMPFEDYQLERFMVLNGLSANDKLRAGQKVKTIIQK
ncbi:MAG: M48 family metalloprotease [Alphaproteobacteria bacterium]|nr:M48 family metalloprotease [Alphaproteobacteria bacterium]